VLEPGVAVVQGDAAVEGLVNLHFGSGKAVSSGLRMNLQSQPIPLHDVVVADDAFVREAADAFEIGGSGPPGFLRFARRAGEAAVVIGNEAAQHAIGGSEIAGGCQAQFAGEAILQHAPEAFDAAFGLRGLRGDEGDAELREGAAELGGLTLAGELFVEGPALVVAGEDAAAVAVEGQRNAAALQQALQQVEIALGRFREEEASGQDFAGGVILHAENGEARAAAFEPVVRGAVELNEFAFARRAEAALTMSGRAALARRAVAGGAQDAAHGFAAQGESFLFEQFFVEMMIVEAAITGARQSDDPIALGVRCAVRAGAAAAGVCQSRCAALPIGGFEAFDVPRR